MKLLPKRFVVLDEGTQHERLEKPCRMSLVPFHGAGFRTRLHHLIFSRHTRRHSTCRRPHGLVLGPDGAIPHVAFNSAAISLYRFYLAWRCAKTGLSHNVLLKTFHSAHTESDSSVLSAKKQRRQNQAIGRWFGGY